jgi:hypothetical protein
MIIANTVAEAIYHLNNLSVCRPKDGLPAGDLTVTSGANGTPAHCVTVHFHQYSVIVQLIGINSLQLQQVREAYDWNVANLLPYILEVHRLNEERHFWTKRFNVDQSKIFQSLYQEHWDKVTAELKACHNFYERRKVKFEADLVKALREHPEFIDKESHPEFQGYFEKSLGCAREASPGIHADGIDGDIRKYAETIQKMFPALLSTIQPEEI